MLHFFYYSIFLLVPTSGFAYSLGALSEDEDADEEETEEPERNPITQEQFTAALQVSSQYQRHILNSMF